MAWNVLIQKRDKIIIVVTYDDSIYPFFDWDNKIKINEENKKQAVGFKHGQRIHKKKFSAEQPFDDFVFYFPDDHVPIYFSDIVTGGHRQGQFRHVPGDVF